MYSDAYIVHAQEGDGYNKSNPFHRLPLPPNWPVLVGKDDFAAVTEEEEGLYSFFSWSAYRYQSGILKFHLDPKITQSFWSIIGKRFISAGVMCMVWKCGRPHNLEFHFFFSKVVGLKEIVPKKVSDENQGSADNVDKDEMAAPHTQINPDLYNVVRNQAIVYFTTVAAYTEVHRTVTFINPIVDLMSSRVDEARDRGESNFITMSSVVRGYRDVSFIPLPEVHEVDVNGEKYWAARAAKSGRGKLAKGISSQAFAEDPFNDAIREAMELDEGADSFVEVTERRKAGTSVPAASFKKTAASNRPYYHRPGKK